MNNIYLVDAGDHEVVAEYIDFGDVSMSIPFARHETVRLVDVVIAPTRGKARAMFVNHHRRDAWLEFTDAMSIRQLQRDTDREQGIVEDWEDLPLDVIRKIDEDWYRYLVEEQAS